MTKNEQIQEMAREICDLSAEFKTCRECNEEYEIDDTLCFCQHMAKEIINHGYRKVERGEWIEKTHEWDFGPPWDYTDYTCSLCGIREQNKRKFCPECGADMRGEEK